MKEFFTALHFTSDTWRLIAPIIMICIDFATGIIYAWSSKTFSSKKMRTGLTKKIGEIFVIVVGEVLSFALGLPEWIMSAIAVYIIFMELMSVFENLDHMGVKIPAFVQTVINNTSDALAKDDYKTLSQKLLADDKEIEALKKAVSEERREHKEDL